VKWSPHARFARCPPRGRVSGFGWPGATDLELHGERVLLRRWRADDRRPFAALNADPAVMRHFPARLSRADSNAMVDRIDAHFDAQGWGLWALEVREIGWRLMRRLGLAERARFDHPRLPEGHPVRPHVVYGAFAPESKAS
jgi:Acetyltransferase (GNAT) domain